MKPKIILLDFDGTVIDTMNDYVRIASGIISKYAKLDKDWVTKKYIETSGMDFPTQLKIMKISSELISCINNEFIYAKRKILTRKKIPSTVIEFVELLKKKGYTIALSTNNECNVISEIKEIEIFDDILCFDGKEHKKGLPHLLALIRKYDIHPRQIIFIGDSDHDLNVYKKYGVKSLKTKGLYLKEETQRLINTIVAIDV